MQIFERNLTKTHDIGKEWPSFLGQVELGESFIIETMNQECDPNGPIEILGIKKDDCVAIHIEKIEIDSKRKYYAPNGGPFFEGMGNPIPIEYRDGYFHWPKYFKLKVNPSIGNIAILPNQDEENLRISRIINYGSDKGKPNPKGWRTIVRAPRDKHSHQDCWALKTGCIIHMKAQVDGLGLCVDDIHAYIGQGEVGFDGIGVYGEVQLRVESSTDWYVDWPIIETKDEIMIFNSYTSTYPHREKQRFVDVVRNAYWTLRDVVAHKIGGTIGDANSIVATATNIRNCVLYGLGDYIQKEGPSDQADYDIAIVACLSKDVFVG